MGVNAVAKMRDVNVWNVPGMSGGKVALYKLVNQNHNLDRTDILKSPAGLHLARHSIRRQVYR